MYVLTYLVFLVLPAGLATFLFWRAYQLGVKHRLDLARQWISRPPDGIEAFARFFVLRDLIFGCGLFLCLVLILTLPRHFSVWIPLMGVFSFVHQGFTGYALQKLKKKQQT